MNFYYAEPFEVYREIRRHCSENFYKKYSEKIYRCYREEYEPLFGKDAIKDIKRIVEEFRDFFGEE